MTWSSGLPVPPRHPVDPGLAASAAALLSALVREEPRPVGGQPPASPAPGARVPAPRVTPADEDVPADPDAAPAASRHREGLTAPVAPAAPPARRRGFLGRR